MKKPEKNHPKPAPEAPAASATNYSLDDLQEAVATPFEVAFVLRGKTYGVIARHLTPEESEQIKLILDEVMPPLIKGKTEADDRMDYTNPEFMTRQTQATRKARALAIFWTCEAFQQKLAVTNPEAAGNRYSPASRDAIVSFMGKLLVDDLQQLIYMRILTVPVSVPAAVNFT